MHALLYLYPAPHMAGQRGRPTLSTRQSHSVNHISEMNPMTDSACSPHHLQNFSRGRGQRHLRLRPILMTTLTTILGLLPMALSWGEGAELRTPLAITVISGLLFSTLITLVVIPAAYMLVPSRIEPDEPELQEGESP